MVFTSERKNDFTQGSIARAILGMSVPITLAQLINVLYNVVDRIYIGHIPGAGSLAFTGLGLCLPITTIAMAFSRLCGMGGAPLCSIERGKGNDEKAELIMGNSFCLLLVLAAILTVMGLVFMRGILYAFGASDETYPYASAYASIYLMGNVAVLISLGMNSFINAQGFSRIGMLTVALGAIANIILDPIFIFALHMGVRGAAIATVIAQSCSAVWVMHFLTGKKAILKLKLCNMRIRVGLARNILGLGTAGFNMSITNAIVQVIANRMLLSFGGDLYVGIMTAINSVREVVMMPIQGLTSGSEPVIGYNYGAGRFDRVRGAIGFMTRTAAVYNTVTWLIIMTVPTLLMRVFVNDPLMLEAGKSAFRIYYAGYCLMVLQFSAQSSFVALGQSKKAIFFSLLRKVIIVVPLMLILPYVGNLGVSGVFLAEPISSLIGGTASFTTMALTVLRPMKRLERETEERLTGSK
ncbi:MAG: MATE family efflux transporter [Oscillospiraceae bacterium]